MCLRPPFHRNFSISSSGLTPLVLPELVQDGRGAARRPSLNHMRARVSPDERFLPFGELSEVTDTVNLDEGSYLGCRVRKQDTWLAALEVLAAARPPHAEVHRGGTTGDAHLKWSWQICSFCSNLMVKPKPPAEEVWAQAQSFQKLRVQTFLQHNFDFYIFKYII